MTRLMWAFFTRDFLTESSYRVSFIMSLVGVVFTTFTFYFVSQLVGEDVPSLAAYGGDYFSFVLIGVAFGSYFGVGLHGFSRALRQAQTTGTLEAMIMTPAPLSHIIIGSATWSYAFTTLRVFIYLLVGTVLLGVSFRGANYLGALLALILSIIAFASMGIIAASVIMVIKRGDPVTSLIGSVSTLVGGVLYPVEILPDWLQAVARLLPLTYALRSMRLALLSGASWQELLPDLLVLLFFCIVLFPLSLYAFRQAVRRVRIEGTLTHY